KNNLFEIVIQFGAILAVCLVYRKRIFEVIFNLNQKKQQKFSHNIALAFLPAAILGVLFHKVIKEFLFSNLAISLSLIIGGIIMIIVDHKPRKSEINDVDEITPFKALLIGFFQSLAMMPGVSRSGATIIGGLLLKFNRKVATDFSFFLAIPTIFAASFYDLAKNINDLDTSNIELILVGIFSSFISAILVIKWFLNYVSKNNFVIFGVYRIIVGFLILYLSLL
ncbi:MAG: undecaprenyl-diphosphate phosphatase, partial [Pelagibacterales bacterium]|nr:undecaprenyl-diphosphate phosphatase [Pelagibacterales bacterium]